MANGDYALAVTLLSHMDLSDLPVRYAGLSATLQEANYQEALSLYQAGKPYEALPYFRAAKGYRGTESYMKKSCYLILGDWQTEDGRRYSFMPDGHCVLNGEALCFSVPNEYELLTGAEAGNLEKTHSITRIDDKYLTLRDLRDNRNQIIVLTRNLDGNGEKEENPSAFVVQEDDLRPAEGESDP